MKKLFMRALALTLILCALFSMTGCFTPSKKLYKSSEKYSMTDEKGAKSVTDILRAAEQKTDSLKDIQYTYSYFVEYESNKDTVKLGNKNVISIKDRNLPTMTAHRQNSYANLKNGASTQQDQVEDFYYSEGAIYTKRFGKDYKSPMPAAGFIEYTEYSSLSVNTDYLSEIFYDNARIYKRFKGITEIAFTGAAEYLKNYIASFIGLNQTSYKYEINDVLLTVLIDKDGYLTEKHLKFNVEYYSEKDPNNVITYLGDFAYTVDCVKDFEVTPRPGNVTYQSIDNIHLISSLTDKGYEVLFNHTAISATYKKSVEINDEVGNKYTYKSNVDVRSLIKDGKCYYSSIDTEHLLKNYTTETDEEKYDTVGIFVGDHGYSERQYDYLATGEKKTVIDRAEHDYTANELYSVMSATLGAEQLAEGEIYSFSVLSEDTNTVTYSVIFTNASTKEFAGYLFDTFTSEHINTQAYAFEFDKCDITITVRKSDGCLLEQIIDYKGTLVPLTAQQSKIIIQGKCEVIVNSTQNNFPLLTEQNFNDEVSANLAQ